MEHFFTNLGVFRSWGSLPWGRIWVTLGGPWGLKYLVPADKRIVDIQIILNTFPRYKLQPEMGCDIRC